MGMAPGWGRVSQARFSSRLGLDRQAGLAGWFHSDLDIDSRQPGKPQELFQREVAQTAASQVGHARLRNSQKIPGLRLS